ncbi:magnesium chelatase subunit D family protein [Glycomyces sp. TRM65418]|uniref:magnesium chelatase subunit D family protein n=1 Tax=Glycomyces sp. TRM65418 TaxID=2867006 RepID=UPI001CE6D753|nr:magnesium chelatase subunit D family protein [Glycomyces sp. TRM65418]MCC3764550.1 magnesium chelatase subunit D family protein [Glycomyces sp. TRM65418]QZD54217.1 magnesium chelatase subunit D family protein [Glycomyces sp. TRM65418]
MTYPFTALVGSEQLTVALVLGAVDPRIGGVLVRGSKGSAKSTAVRGLAALLPDIATRAGCAYNCPPDRPADLCPTCADAPVHHRPTPLVELPVGASEDRLIGSIDLERALSEGVRSFQPGLLARAHRGLLYVDEVNLLDDHLVDALLDSAAMGWNHVEREGVSARHPARFQLVGTMNPEEGELRPQLLDRFGLTVEATAPLDPGQRAEVVRRRLAYDADPEQFADRFATDEKRLAERLVAARDLLEDVALDDFWLLKIAEVCAAFGVDGMRADIVTARTAAALAAWDGRAEVTRADVRAACLLALPHRRRRGPFDDPGIDEDELDRLLGDDEPEPPQDGPEDGPGDGPDRGPGDGPDDGPDDRDGHGPGPVSNGPPSQEVPESETGPERGSSPQSTAESAPQPTEELVPAPSGRVEAATETAAAPALITAPQRRFGASGRRSRGRSRRGAAVRNRPLRDGEAPHASDLAVSATLIAASLRRHASAGAGMGGPGQALVGRNDLRHYERSGKQGHLIVLCVDASGSMGARRRMGAVKGAVRALLFDAYQRRDLVALVTFRGRNAETALPPTAGVELADRRLAVLPTGGRTPLAAGLLHACGLIERHARRDPDRRPLLVAVTDGRANATAEAVAESRRAAAHLAAKDVPALVVDTESGFVRTGLAAELARHLAAPCVELEQFASGELARTIRLATGR